MNERFESSSGFKQREKSNPKIDLNKIINGLDLEGDNFSELCDSSVLFNIDTEELDRELNRVKKKLLKYEESLKTVDPFAPPNFVGYTKPEEPPPPTTQGDKAPEEAQINKTESDKPVENETKDEKSNEANETEKPEEKYDIELLKKNIYEAVIDGNVSKASDLLDMPGADLNMTMFSENLLMSAIRNNQERMAEFLIYKGINVDFETELIEFKGEKKPFHYVKYSCRDLAYGRNMHHIVNLIDVFHKETDKRIVKYLGKKLIRRMQTQQQQQPKPMAGYSLYEKRMKTTFEKSKVFFDHTGEAFEVSQMINNKINEEDYEEVELTSTALASLMDEVDQMKPPSDFFEPSEDLKPDEQEKKTAEPTKSNNDQNLKDNNMPSFLITSDQTMESQPAGPNDLLGMILTKLKQQDHTEMVKKRHNPKLNNKKVLNYENFKVDMLVKDPTECQMDSPKSPRIGVRRTLSSKSNLIEINLDKECEIVDVQEIIKPDRELSSPVGLKRESNGVARSKSHRSQKYLEIPHMVPQSVATFSMNERFYAKKSRPGTVAKSDPINRDINRLKSFTYVSELSEKRSSAKHLMDEFKKENVRPLSITSSSKPVVMPVPSRTFKEINSQFRVANLSKSAKVVQTSNNSVKTNHSNQAMDRYLESLKKAGLWNENSKPVIRNLKSHQQVKNVA